MTAEMYETVCRERFQSQSVEIAEIREDTQYLRAKIDNGLSSVPGQINKMESQQRKMIGGIISAVISFIVMILAGAGIWLYTFGRMEERLDNHITASNEIMSEVLEQTE